MKFSILALGFAIVAFGSFSANATPAFATKEKKACGYCHLRAAGGGARGFRGTFYDANQDSFKGYNEKKQAKLAGVAPNAMGPKSKATKPYDGKAK
jgi:hypothetical protein